MSNRDLCAALYPSGSVLYHSYRTGSWHIYIPILRIQDFRLYGILVHLSTPSNDGRVPHLLVLRFRFRLDSHSGTELRNRLWNRLFPAPLSFEDKFDDFARRPAATASLRYIMTDLFQL